MLGIENGMKRCLCEGVRRDVGRTRVFGRPGWALAAKVEEGRLGDATTTGAAVAAVTPAPTPLPPPVSVCVYVHEPMSVGCVCVRISAHPPVSGAPSRLAFLGGPDSSLVGDEGSRAVFQPIAS